LTQLKKNNIINISKQTELIYDFLCGQISINFPQSLLNNIGGGFNFNFLSPPQTCFLALVVLLNFSLKSSKQKTQQQSQQTFINQNSIKISVIAYTSKILELTF